jgi:CRISPR/Cas system-associated exonuclease Cas4 (RecB family)
METEEFEHFFFNDIKVWVVPDLIIKENSHYKIIDWKTGKDVEGGTAEVQLGVYSLYGTQKWGIPPDKITVHESNLRHGKSYERQMTQERIEWVANHIIRSANKMKSVLDDPDDNIASIDKFPMTEDTLHCHYCNFRRFCDRENL